MPVIKTRDGTEIFAKDWGEGRPVVLTHGYPLNADSFDKLANKLVEAGHRVINYDRRGFGRSGQRKIISTSKLIEYNGHPHGFYQTNSDQMIADTLAFLRA